MITEEIYKVKARTRQNVTTLYPVYYQSHYQSSWILWMEQVTIALK